MPPHQQHSFPQQPVAGYPELPQYQNVPKSVYAHGGGVHQSSSFEPIYVHARQSPAGLSPNHPSLGGTGPIRNRPSSALGGPIASNHRPPQPHNAQNRGVADLVAPIPSFRTVTASPSGELNRMYGQNMSANVVGATEVSPGVWVEVGGGSNNSLNKKETSV
jgi:hypothetical protein